MNTQRPKTRPRPVIRVQVVRREAANVSRQWECGNANTGGAKKAITEQELIGYFLKNGRLLGIKKR